MLYFHRRTRMKVLGTLLFVLLASTAHAQQRGMYWNDWTQRWEWRGGGEPTRPYPPGSSYPEGQIPRRDLDCLGENCYREYRSFGGRNKQVCHRPNGQAYYCYY